ncbi:hypothetical protein IAG44_39575 [Streptomyces roseirectus]|uniref:Uncharacterized protein n=1 Tax=Streptomyces roseirectus TaxID=2768066 RepID=A0A7H0IQ61_9ACTN|nr:hypothetical protein IAG44_39575 [Streptomyces roseirectus]
MNIPLPNQPAPQQQFVTTPPSESGRQFDNTSADIMRVPQGQIFPVIAEIRTAFRNTPVRQLAELANGPRPSREHSVCPAQRVTGTSGRC